MAKYIEQTLELILAANAGARAIENTKRYHGAIYARDAFDTNKGEIAYLQAAKVLREIEDAPAADVAPVVRCKDCENIRPEVDIDTGDPAGYWCCLFDFSGVDVDGFCSYGERKENSDA